MRIYTPREFTLLFLLFLLVASTLLFLAIGEVVNKGTIQRFDDGVLTGLRSPDQPGALRGPVWMGEMMRDITSFGGGPAIALITLAVAGFLLMQRQYKLLIFLLVAVIGGVLLEAGLKELYGRGRPTVVPHLMAVGSQSFPSGHSMMSATIYLTLASLITPLLPDRATRVYVVAVAAVLALLIGVSRVFLGVHYPTDVLAGWTLGLAWASACWIVERYWLRPRLDEASRLRARREE